VGPWNFQDYLFPVLVESGKTFLGLGVQRNDSEEPNIHENDSWRGNEENQEQIWTRDTTWNKGVEK
jgi:hypothetical protein